MNTTTATPKQLTAGDIFQKTSENLSTITDALEKAHAIIRQETGAPRATILVTRKTGRTMGHFTHAEIWKGENESFREIMISANYFTRGARAVLGTLLHETAHSMDLAEGRKGTSGDGYHNKIFKSTAESLGLSISNAPGIGWSVTEVSDECADRWSSALRLIEDALKLTADADAVKGTKGRNKNLLVAECGCGNKIRLSKSVLEMSRPVCQICEQMFEEKGE